VSGLAEKTCIPCKGGEPPLPHDIEASLLAELDGWQAVDHHHLTKTYRFKNFERALQFVDRVGAIAEEQWHHPDIYLAWGKVRIDIWTHKIDGLTESDFIFAAKCDKVYAQQPAVS
jgi:4a-hydroxytetrahydrobiopterin dehydratase